MKVVAKREVFNSNLATAVVSSISVNWFVLLLRLRFKMRELYWGWCRRSAAN